MIEVIHELYEYNRWANERVLAAASVLTPEQFTRDLGSSFPSVRDTLLHILSADWIWLSRWRGTSPSGMPAEWANPTFEVLRSRYATLEADRSAFLAGLTEASLDDVIEYRNIQGQPFANPLGVLLRHVVNHSTYHRGQVVTMLRQLGVPAVSTDLVLFHRERVAARA